MLQQAYGEDCLSRTQCYEWYQRFKSDRTSIEDDPKSGRPSSTGDDHIEKVRSVICENRRLTIREVSEEVGICKSSCHTILTEKLKVPRVAAKFVPRLLTEEQKQNRVSISQELLDRSNTDENFLKNVITGNWSFPNFKQNFTQTRCSSRSFILQLAKIAEGTKHTFTQGRVTHDSLKVA